MTFHHLFQFRKKTRSVIQGPNSLGLLFFMQEMQVGKLTELFTKKKVNFMGHNFKNLTK